jgi:D-alanine-D-alanine ligase
MRKLRVMTLMHQDLVPPENPEGVDLSSVAWKTEFDVLTTLADLGHEKIRKASICLQWRGKPNLMC